jgi:hypothetical protein
VTDEGLKDLAGFKNLQALFLVGTQMTDKGLNVLTGLKSLRRLDLDPTRVTREGIAELRKALPNCRVYP